MNINRIFRKVAAESGITVTELRNEMQTAIEEGLKNPDPKVQEYWSSIPHKGEKPTPEEVIAFANKAAKNRKSF